MNVRKRWLLAASVVVIGAAMSLAIACSSDNKNDNNPTATESAASGSPTAMETPSGTGTPEAMASPGQTMAAGEVHIAEVEYSIKGEDTATIASPPAGKVTFEVHNNGTVAHSFYIFKTDTAEGDLALSGTTVDEEKAGTNEGEIETIAVGEAKTLTIDNLPAGKYVLLCNLPGHYQQGMHAAFEVM